MIVAYQGLVGPNAYILALTPGASGIDLTTVSAATLQVRLPDGTTAVWTVTLSNQTTTTLTLTHLYGVNDLVQVGTYAVFALLTIPSGTIESHPQQLVVRAKFDTSP